MFRPTEAELVNQEGLQERESRSRPCETPNKRYMRFCEMMLTGCRTFPMRQEYRCLTDDAGKRGGIRCN